MTYTSRDELYHQVSLYRTIAGLDEFSTVCIESWVQTILSRLQRNKNASCVAPLAEVRISTIEQCNFFQVAQNAALS